MKTGNTAPRWPAVASLLIGSSLSAAAAMMINVHSSTLTWDSTPGETYRIMRNTNLLINDWQPVYTNTATNVMSTWQYTSDTDEKFFRLQIEQTGAFSYVDADEIVGYAKTYVRKDGDYAEIAAVGNNFIPHTNDLIAAIGDQLPPGSAIYLWNQDTDQWDTGVRNLRGTWNNQLTIELGDALFILLPPDAPDGTNTVYMSGRVVTDAAYPTQIETGLSLMAFPYPVDIHLVDTEMGSALPNNSLIYLWVNENYSYWAGSKNAHGGWNTNPLIPVTSAYWIVNAGAVLNVDESCPFEY